jgi:hypothetical protein
MEVSEKAAEASGEVKVERRDLYLAWDLDT